MAKEFFLEDTKTEIPLKMLKRGTSNLPRFEKLLGLNSVESFNAS